jgi:hypothetical protein
VIGTTREFAVTSEITQMGLAIESFKTEYGFYPPSFEQFKRTVNTGDSAPLPIVHAEAQQILPFLNKIAPNHQEASAPSPVRAGYTRLDDWWEFVGCNLDQSTSLQFWLAGLSQNKQFPLSLTPADSGDPMSNLYLPVAYNVNVFVNADMPVEIPASANFDRKVFYDFDKDRMVPVSIFDGNEEMLPITQYVMEHGKTNGDLFYVYRDSGSYTPFAQPMEEHLDPNNRTAVLVGGSTAPGYATSAYPAYLSSPNHRGLAYHFLLNGPTSAAPLQPTFANPNTFQLIAFGLDGDPGVQDPDTGLFIDNVNRGNLNAQGPRSSDNLCNFATGRLDKYITEQQ